MRRRSMHLNDYWRRMSLCGKGVRLKILLKIAFLGTEKKRGWSGAVRRVEVQTARQVDSSALFVRLVDWEVVRCGLNVRPILVVCIPPL